jgi:hypothetical protein
MIEKLPENYGIVVDIMGEKEINHYAVAIILRDMRDKINEIIDLLPTNNKEDSKSVEEARLEAIVNREYNRIK